MSVPRSTLDPAALAAAGPDKARAATAFLRDAHVERFDNGLTVCVSSSKRAPVAATAIAYAAGTRHEAAGEEGAAHFLEHMMFKGSARYPAGAVDRLTQSLGGANNAFTSHDLALYHFSFAADRWPAALEIEADRMRGLTLDPREVASERQVIVEEIAMYEGEPWDALDESVAASLFGDAPYGRPVLGTRASLAGLGADELRAVHRRLYTPTNAQLVIVGDVAVDEAIAGAHAAFDDLQVPGGAGADRAATDRAATDRAATDRAEVDPVPPAVARSPREERRVERRAGELARLLMAFEAPSAVHPDHALLRLVAGVLANGRASRLHRALVDDGQLCVWVSVDLADTVAPGSLSIAAEVLPGVAPEQVEAAVRAELQGVVDVPPTVEEIERVRRLILSEWLFGHEKADRRAFLLASSLTLFDLEQPAVALERLLGAEPEAVADAARRWLGTPSRSVVGWSLPKRTRDA
ncbi:MAG: pitrilysin family protein [Acidobacteriota bacterium]